MTRAQEYEENYPPELPPGSTSPVAPEPPKNETEAQKKARQAAEDRKAADAKKLANQWNPAYLPSLEQFIGTSLNRQGWRVLGTPMVESKAVFNAADQVYENVESGKYLVTIGSPDGKSIQQFTVARQDAPGTQGTAGGWSIGDAPADIKPDKTQGLYSRVQIDTDGTSYGLNNETNQWEEIKGAKFKTEDKSRYSNVTVGYDGAFYGIDTQTGKPVKIEGASVPQSPRNAQMLEINGKWHERNDVTGIWEAAKGLPTDVANAPEGARRRQLGTDGYAYVQKRQYGEWINDPDVPKEPVTEAAKADDEILRSRPKDKDTRPNVKDGFNIQEIRRNGEWIEDPSVPRTRANPLTPSTITTDTKNRYIYRTDETGKLIQSPNENYQPENVSERMQLLQERAAAKRDELQKQIGQNGYTEQQAGADFDAWWNSNIEPYKAQLVQAQQRQQNEDQIKIQDQQLRGVAQENTNLGTAQAAAQNRVQNYLSTLPYRVGPSFGKDVIENISNAYATGTAPGKISGDAFTFDAPNLDTMYTDAVAQGLKHVSPVASQIAGGQGLQLAQPVDVNSQLQRSQFRPGTVGGLARPVTTTGAATGTTATTDPLPTGSTGNAIAAPPAAGQALDQETWLNGMVAGAPPEQQAWLRRMLAGTQFSYAGA